MHVDEESAATICRDDGTGPPRVVAPHQKPGAVSEFQEFYYPVVAPR